MERFVFIVGPSRTASSTILRALNTHPKIFISRELNFRFRLKKDFVKTFSKFKYKQRNLF